MKRSLLLGAGNSREKKVYFEDHGPEWLGELTTLDMNPNCGADVVHDLEQRPLPFPDETFDEIAAYDVLEHLGKQGDWKGFFDEFAEYHRILKLGGLFGALVPTGRDHFADPGHTRFFSGNHFGFLSQRFYFDNLEKGNPVTDYRWYWKLDFGLASLDYIGDHHISAIMVKQ